MKSIEIRQKFIDFFVARGHMHVPSSPLIPADDPTLLFANAGMNQFKDVFLGKEKRSYTRATTVQKCIRAGGKHNDLDNVGRTARHLTFFEMLGNFSFGDYFKRDAIKFAWEFLTQEIGLDANKLYPSVYQEDDESFEIWNREIGVPAERIVRLGRKDNFWQMGDTGPCGPCSEIYFDRGAQNPSEENLRPGDDCERFLEVWNLVFMQFNRQADGKELPLAQTGVDTGMGLERLCVVVQGTNTVFETDIFAPVFTSIERLTGKNYKAADSETQTAFRVIADHIRSTSLAIADGGMPSNEGRGYVLRKIIRRAALFAQNLGDSMLFAKVAPDFIDHMGAIYPELLKNKDLIVSILTSELEKFSHNLTQGRVILDKYLQEHGDTKQISGDEAFKLYDTYGFPLELTSIVAYKRGFAVDEKGFEIAMEKQRLQSGKKDEKGLELTIPAGIKSEFVGYEQTTLPTKIRAMLVDNEPVTSIPANSMCWVITEQTPLYAESGGQLGDAATAVFGDKTVTIDEIKKVGGVVAFCIKTPTALKTGDAVTLMVDDQRRKDIARNHTATHLLQAALVRVLGPQIKQAGSLVAPDYLRFDFTHHAAISDDQIVQIEQLVNGVICENKAVSIKTMTYRQALDAGATAFFGEKYNPESVRVVDVPSFSAELCGGTHVKSTGEIGCCKITSSTALAAGVRRITAVTGAGAVALFQQTFATVHKLAQQLKVPTESVLSALAKQEEAHKKCAQELQKARTEIIRVALPEMLAKAEKLNDMPLGCFEFAGADGKQLRDIAAQCAQNKPGLYLVYANSDSGSMFVLVRSTQFAEQINLAALNTWMKEQGLKGGMRDEMITGGGVVIDKKMIDSMRAWLVRK